MNLGALQITSPVGSDNKALTVLKRIARLGLFYAALAIASFFAVLIIETLRQNPINLATYLVVYTCGALSAVVAGLVVRYIGDLVSKSMPVERLRERIRLILS